MGKIHKEMIERLEKISQAQKQIIADMKLSNTIDLQELLCEE